ncbi:TetR/AcrR family transcriptional regulator [Streptococcus pneumoniae]|uniref:TetR/AcrR family transcriptional regulator n=1 Tax=Streptococcus pneumoniae TaxID=1313 RepID=UPI003980604E
MTIQKICDIAEINRSTFYRYFQDKYDLLFSYLTISQLNLKMYIWNYSKVYDTLLLISQTFELEKMNRSIFGLCLLPIKSV